MKFRFIPLKRFAKHAQGSTAIEFALVIPMLFFLLFATMEIALVMFVTTAIESVTNQAGRIGKTGFLAGGYASREDYITAEIKKKLGDLIDVGRLDIEYKTYNEFSNVNEPEPACPLPSAGCVPKGDGTGYIDVNGNGTFDIDQAAAGTGGAGDVVVYDVEYDWVLLTPMVDIISRVWHLRHGTYGGAAGLFGTADVDGDGTAETVHHIRAISVVQNEPSA